MQIKTLNFGDYKANVFLDEQLHVELVDPEDVPVHEGYFTVESDPDEAATLVFEEFKTANPRYFDAQQ